ncbi:MAG: hypothetical protein KDK61_09070 [Simkania sp.]|nr:hypothetical protein [Simkania sp.]
MGEFSCFFAIPTNMRSKDFYLKTLVNPIVYNVTNCANKTASFIQNNWRSLILFIVAGGVIIGGVGLMYGFEAVSLPLVIGFGCGLPIASLSGIIVTKWIDPEGKIENNTLWQLINAGLNKLPANGARPIVISVAVTVILAASAVFPLVMGIGFGILIGNHVATKIGLQQNFSSEGSQRKAQKLRDRVDHLIKEMQDIQTQLNALINEDDEPDEL